MTPAPPAVSVIMRSFNEAWAIGDTIRQLFAQDFAGDIELIVIDSGSTDGSIEMINHARPAKLIEIPLGTYVPGVVLNQGARMASHEWLVDTWRGTNWCVAQRRASQLAPASAVRLAQRLGRLADYHVGCKFLHRDQVVFPSTPTP